MTIKNYIFFSIISLGIVINAFSQVKQINSEDYYQPIREYYKKRNEVSHRIITKKEYYKDGKLSRMVEIIDEFLKPDRNHYLEREKTGDRVSESELIKVGEIYYCRRNKGEWKQSSSWCAGGGIGGLSNIVSSKFTVEIVEMNNQTAKLYQQYTTYKNIHSPDKDKEGLSYFHSKNWINDEGFILRKEAKSGLLEPERIYSQEVELYEYNPKNLKIETPIK
jgi:hypothetical protein